jgi:hypothetical protein
VAASSAPPAAGFYLLVLAAPGLLLGESLARGRGLLRGCAWAFAALVAEIGAGLAFASAAMAKLSLAPIENLRSEAFLSELKASGLPPERIAEFTEQVGTLRDALAIVFPAAWVIGAAALVAANAAVLRLYLLRRDPGWLEDGEFERVRFSLALVVVFVCRARPWRAAGEAGRLQRAAGVGLLLRPPGAGRRRLLRPPPGRAAPAARRRCWSWCWPTPGPPRSSPCWGCSTTGSISAGGPSPRPGRARGPGPAGRRDSISRRVMELILRDDVEKLGRRGDVVKVKDGYARNFLLPRGLGMPVTAANKAMIEKERKAQEARLAKEKAEFEALAARIGGLRFVAPAQGGRERAALRLGDLRRRGGVPEVEGHRDRQAQGAPRRGDQAPRRARGQDQAAPRGAGLLRLLVTKEG